MDTLEDLRAELGPDVELFFITGADALAGLPTWHRAEEIPAPAHLVGVTRPGHELGAGHGLPDGSVTYVQIPALDISSSDCRARVAAGAPIRYLVPDGVADYVAEHGLYRGAGA